MRPIVYSLRFVGHVTPLSASKDLWWVTSTGASCSVTTLIGPEGMRAVVERIPGDVARCTATLCLIGSSAFAESCTTAFTATGTIAFGEHGHRLHFVTRREGLLLPSPLPGRRLGSVIWQVDGGEGRFGGARGVITSNFLIDDDGKIEDVHSGTIFLQ
jgi:hypothetical protein